MVLGRELKLIYFYLHKYKTKCFKNQLNVLFFKNKILKTNGHSESGCGTMISNCLMDAEVPLVCVIPV